MDTQNTFNTTGTSTNSLYAPQFIDKAGATLDDAVANIKNDKGAQLQRIQDYIQRLARLKSMAQRSAASAGARGANGMQNPLAVYKSVESMANQAGVPIEAEMAKQLQTSNNVENTLNTMLQQAAQIYGQLGAIKGNMSGYSSIGGSSSGRGKGPMNGGPEGGTSTDIRGGVTKTVYDPATGQPHVISEQIDPFTGAKTSLVDGKPSQAGAPYNPNYRPLGQPQNGPGYKGLQGIPRAPLDLNPGFDPSSMITHTGNQTTNPPDAGVDYSKYLHAFDYFNPEATGEKGLPDGGSMEPNGNPVNLNDPKSIADNATRNMHFQGFDQIPQPQPDEPSSGVSGSWTDDLHPAHPAWLQAMLTPQGSPGQLPESTALGSMFETAMPAIDFASRIQPSSIVSDIGQHASDLWNSGSDYAF